MLGQIILDPHSHKNVKAQKLSIAVHPGFLEKNPGLSLLNLLFPLSINKLIHQLKPEFSHIQSSNNIVDLQEILIKTNFYKSEEKILDYNLLKHSDWNIAQVQYYNQKTKQRSVSVFISIKCSLSESNSILLKPKKIGGFENTPSIIKYLSEYRSDLSPIDVNHLPELNEVYNCFGVEDTLVHHSDFIKLSNRLLQFQKNLKEYIQNHYFKRNNRNFISFFKTHKSPMDISILEDKIVFRMNDYQFFPLNNLCNSKYYTQKIKYLINQIHLLS